MTMTEPSYPTSLPMATVTSNPINEKWKTRFPASRRYPFSAETDTPESFSGLTAMRQPLRDRRTLVKASS